MAALGTRIEKGDAIAEIAAKTEADAMRAAHEIANALTLSPQTMTYVTTESIIERVTSDK
jgi:hypothetical protein